ncbi:MAG TPA: AraC family transcriptional regulator [Kofleriaceae bacterium]|nr:AraC family transcriptional regulator [Kofleriaceae bacterium]
MRGRAQRADEARRLRARPVLHDFSEPAFVSRGWIVPARPALAPLVAGITHNAFVGPVVAAYHMYRLPEAVSWLLVASGGGRVRALVVGPRTRVDIDSLPPWTTAMEGAILRAGALGELLGLPLAELTDRTVELEEVLPAEGRALRLALEDAAGPVERLVLVEEALVELARRRALEVPPVSVRVADAVARRVVVPAVDELERIVGWSQRQLRRRCERDLGLAPKRYLRLLRFTRVIEALRAPRRPEWRMVAAQLGYADQSHLIHEFRTFTGMTPAAFVGDPSAAPALRHGAVPRPRAR